MNTEINNLSGVEPLEPIGSELMKEEPVLSKKTEQVTSPKPEPESPAPPLSPQEPIAEPEGEQPSLQPILTPDAGSDVSAWDEVKKLPQQKESVTPNAEVYWHQVLTGNPETVPHEVRDRAGAEDAALSPEQREYVLCSAINRSWLADHSEHPRRDLLVNWGKYRAELAEKLGVAADDKEIFVALSAREGESARRELARRVYEHAYMTALHGESSYSISQLSRDMSPDDRDLAETIARNAFSEGQIMRARCMPHARDLADGFDVFYSAESQFLSLPDVMVGTPGLMRAVDKYGELSEEDRQTTVYLAAHLHRQKLQSKGENLEEESMFARSVRAVRRGAGNLGFGVMQAVNNSGIAVLDNLGEFVGGKVGDSLREEAAAWDSRMRNFNEIRHLAQQQNTPLLRPNAGRAEMFFLEGAQAVPAAVLSCCGGAGFGSLALSSMGESVAEARRRAPEGPQKLQAAVGVIAGAVQAGIYMGLNRLGGRMFEQTLNNFMKARGSGWVNYSLAGLKSAGAMTVDGVKLMLGNKAAAATDLAAHELAARASATASNIDWELFGDSITDIECNLREAGATLPFLLIGAGRLALRHFRSPDGVLGSGRRLLEWKVPEEKVKRILSEKDIDVQNDLLREAICKSELWDGKNRRYSMDIIRAMQLLHADRYLPFKIWKDVKAFLNLSSDFAPAHKSTQKPPNTERTQEALTLRGIWEERAALDGSQPIDLAERRVKGSGSGRSGVLNGRGCYRNAYMLSYENMAEKFTFLHRNGYKIPEVEPIRRAVLTTYADELQKCSYRMLLQLYPQDTMTLGTELPLPQLKEQAEATRQRYLDLVGKTILDMASGLPRALVYDELANECGKILGEYRAAPQAPGWLLRVPDYLIDNIVDECRSYDNKKMDGFPDMRTFYRLLHRTRVCAAVLTDFLPMSDEFQEYILSGHSPSQAYGNYVEKVLGYKSPAMEQAELPRNVALREKFEQKSARDLELYSTMTGFEPELSPPDANGERYWRMLRPDGQFTPWFKSKQQLANSIAGHNVVLFAPIGSRADKFIASDFHNPDAPLTLPTAGELEYSSFDRLCSDAVAELAYAWMADASHIQPGMRRNTHKKLNVSMLYNSIDLPIVEYMFGKKSTAKSPFYIDQYAMMTPAGLAYSRFIVYWARQLNSGIINAEHAGNFLMDKQLISREQMAEILHIGEPRPMSWWNRARLGKEPEGNVLGMNLKMAEQMGRFTFLCFLARLPELNLPWTVKTWYNSLAFCPEVAKIESPVQGRGGAPFRPGKRGEFAMMWYNSQMGVRLRELAPQVEFYRKNYNDLVNDELVRRLLPAALDDDLSLRAEQAWAHHFSGDNVFECAGSEYWNLLRQPLEAWQSMEPSLKASYAEGLRNFLRETTLPVIPRTAGDADSVDAAIINLDKVLSQHPSLHYCSFLKSDSSLLHSMQLQDYRPFVEFNSDTPVWQLDKNQNAREDYLITANVEWENIPRSPEMIHALNTLDYLRSITFDMPYQASDGNIMWKGRRYGGVFARPEGLEIWEPRGAISGLRNMLWKKMTENFDDPSEYVTIAGERIPLLSQGELECSPLSHITVYEAHLYAPQSVLRLMPGNPNSGADYMRRPHVVGTRLGVYYGIDNFDADSVPVSAYVPLEQFDRRTLQFMGSGVGPRYNTLRRRIAEHNLDLLFDQVALGPRDYITMELPNETLTELLMRLYEDTGFSRRIDNKNIENLDVGSLLAVRLVAEIISCVSAVDSINQSWTLGAYQRLHETLSMLRSDSERRQLLLDALLKKKEKPSPLDSVDYEDVEVEESDDFESEKAEDFFLYSDLD